MIICAFCGFLDIFLDLDREITWFLIYLDRDIFFSCRNLWKVVGEAQGKLIKVKVKPSPTTFHRCLKSKISRSRLKCLDLSRQSLDLSRQNLDLSRQNLDYLQISRKISFCLDLSRKSRLVSTISIKISTHLYLDWKVSILKISTEIKWKLISIVEKISTVFKS